jgi:hypothetical protein
MTIEKSFSVSTSIEDAVGVRITDPPITPEEFFVAMQRKREEGVE